MKIGQNIKKYRKEKKLTQPELGSLIGKSESSIRKYESENVIPSIDILKSISEALDVPISHILIDPQSDNVTDELNDSLDLMDQFNKRGIDISNYPSIVKIIDAAKNANNSPWDKYENINIEDDPTKYGNEDIAAEHLKAVIYYVSGHENLPSEVYDILFNAVSNTINYELYKIIKNDKVSPTTDKDKE